MSEIDTQNEEENKLTNEEYKIWKKNTPYLYDLVISHALEWPSLTVQFLQEKDDFQDQGYQVQKLLLGTHTIDEQNYVFIADVTIPLETSEFDNREYNNENMEVGGQGNFPKSNRKVNVKQKIAHDGEVNRARYNPFHSTVFATKTVSSEVWVFNYAHHQSQPKDSTARPDLRLRGHEKEGYGLNWSNTRNSYLLSGSDDGRICLWDVQDNEIRSGTQRSLDPIYTYQEHQGVVEDVAWHSKNQNLFGSVGDDKKLIIWDIRKNQKACWTEAHANEINTLAFNPFNEWICATGSSDKSIKLFDLRVISIKPLYELNGHIHDVQQLKWNPHMETILASSSNDKRLLIWDLSRIGDEQTTEEEEEGPPELLFVHGGHTARIPDLSWSQSDKWTLASVDDDNILQVWQMAESIYNRNDVLINDEDDDDQVKIDNQH